MVCRVAVTYSPEVGGSSVISLKKSFASVDFEVRNADFREMMQEITQDEFSKAYETQAGRQKLFAHAKSAAEAMLSNVDCLALSGNSAMIDPSLFNQMRDNDDVYDFARSIAELALVHVAAQKGMPILGVCGGHQVIAVYGGGSIAALNVEQLDKQHYMNYDSITFNANSMLAKILGNTPEADMPLEKEFFGAHAQVVDTLAHGFVSTATASDGILNEAAESEYGAPIITTQFHPEITMHGLPESEFIYQNNEAERASALKLFNFFKKAAETYHNRKTLIDEMKAQMTAIDYATPSISPKVIAQKNNEQDIKPKNNHLKIERDAEASVAKAKQSLFSYIINSIQKFVVIVLRGISTLIVNFISYTMTKKVVNEIKSKETKKLLSSYNKMLQTQQENEAIPAVTLNETKTEQDSAPIDETPSPASILNNTSAKFWKTAQANEPVDATATSHVDKP